MWASWINIHGAPYLALKRAFDRLEHSQSNRSDLYQYRVSTRAGGRSTSQLTNNAQFTSGRGNLSCIISYSVSGSRTPS
jgi:hypothetical protein